jgi:hypothetical protein
MDYSLFSRTLEPRSTDLPLKFPLPSFGTKLENKHAKGRAAPAHGGGA